MQILLNISRSKCNQAMKFGQSTEYNKRNIFLWKSCRKCGRKTGLKALYEVKETACTLISVVHFDSPELAIQSKQTV